MAVRNLDTLRAGVLPHKALRYWSLIRMAFWTARLHFKASDRFIGGPSGRRTDGLVRWSSFRRAISDGDAGWAFRAALDGHR